MIQQRTRENTGLKHTQGNQGMEDRRETWLGLIGHNKCLVMWTKCSQKARERRENSKTGFIKPRKTKYQSWGNRTSKTKGPSKAQETFETQFRGPAVRRAAAATQAKEIQRPATMAMTPSQWPGKQSARWRSNRRTRQSRSRRSRTRQYRTSRASHVEFNEDPRWHTVCTACTFCTVFNEGLTSQTFQFSFAIFKFYPTIFQLTCIFITSNFII